MLFGLGLFTRRDTDRLPIFPRLTAILLCSFTLGLIATAAAKMLKYIDTYGLTRRRIYTLWLMGLLAIVFLIQLLRQFLPRLRAAALIFAAIVLFVGIFLFADFDRMIANYNVNAYLSGETQTVDTNALNELSDAALPALIRLSQESPNLQIRIAAENAIQHRIQNNEERSPLNTNLTTLIAYAKISN